MLRLLWLLPIMSALVCVSCETSPPAAAAHIVFDNIESDFGEVEAGAVVAKEFTFRNAGGRDLLVDKVRASCNDKVSVEPASNFTPGSSGRIVVEVKAESSAGACSHTVTVYANDPAQPVTNLRLNGRINADVSASPAQLYVGRLNRGQDAPFEVDLTLAESVRLTEVAANSRVIGAHLQPSAGNGRSRRVRVTIKPDAPDGKFRESFVVRTTSRRQPELTVAVVGSVDAAER